MPINNTSKEKVIFYRNQSQRPLYIKLLKVDGLIIVDSKERERDVQQFIVFFFI